MSRHRSATTQNRRASLAALTSVVAVLATFLVVAGGLFAPTMATADSAFKKCFKPHAVTKTITATTTATATVKVPGPTQTVSVPGPTKTVSVPGPTQMVTVPGPTQTVTVPGPTQTVTVTPSATATAPGPTATATATATPPGGQKGTQGPGIGVYMSGGNSGLDAYTAGWAAQPNVASFYLPWNNTVAGTPKMAQYAAQGRTLQVELATRYSTGYALWSDIAAGTYDAHIISVIRGLDALGVPVMLSLDNEPDAKATSGTGEVAPGQTAAQYVAAANRFADLIHANATHVQSLVWIAGFKDAATSASFLPAHSKLDNVGWDPYKTGSHAVSETPAQLFSTFITTVLIPNGYGDIPRHILETGIMTNAFSSGASFSAQNQIDFLKGIPAGMAADSISSVMWFRANSGAHDYIPTDSSVDSAFASMTASLLG